MNSWTNVAICKASREYQYHRWEIACSNQWFTLSLMQLRHAVVDCLKPLGRMVGTRMESRFAGRYREYCDHIARDGSWGDELCLLASAHILRRPLLVITDLESLGSCEYIRKICPPPTRVAGVLQSSWLRVLTDTSTRQRLCDAVCLDLPEPRKCRDACQDKEELILGSLTHHQDKMPLWGSRSLTACMPG